jgi:putative ABC transport system permease protein
MSFTRFFRRRRWDQERARELQAYLDIETDANIARGLSPEDARHAAYRKLGNPLLVREEIYRMNTVAFIESLWQDLRYGARLLRLNPGFAGVAVLSLALGIGANTAIFQLIDAIRLRTLPVANPQQLVTVEIANRDWTTGTFSGSYPALTNPLWEQLRDHQQAFSGIAAWGGDRLNLARGGEARMADALLVSGNFFNVLGVTPAAGRVFTAADDRRGCGASGAVISHAFWQSQFGGSASAVGKTLMIEKHPFEVIGVTAKSFFGVEVGHKFDLAIPICSEPVFAGAHSSLDARHEWWLAAIGRLKPGWSIDRASAHLGSISPGLFEATMPQGYGADMKGYLGLKLGAFPLSTGFSSLRQDSSQPLMLLLATTGLILLIACANLANFMLARSSAREREIAVRLAIGASRGRLLRQTLAESLLIAAAGMALGVLIAQWLSRFLMSLITTERNPLFVELTIDWRVLAFATGIAILTCLLFGLVPALRAARTEPGNVMKASGRGMTARHERFGLRRLLVVAQVALSLVLSVSALLFVRSFRNLQTVDTGLKPDGILLTYLDLSGLNLPKDRIGPFKRQLMERLNAVPGVVSAGDATVIPMSGTSWTMGVKADVNGHEVRNNSKFSWVSPAYFRTMGIPLLAGRDVDERDTAFSARVAVVNESFARRFFDGGNPIGKTFRTLAEPGYPEAVYQIVGLVKDTKYQRIREPFNAICFAPWSQDPRERLEMEVLVRSNLPFNGIIPAVKRAIAGTNPDIDLAFRIYVDEIRDTLVRERVMATLSGFFGGLAVLLAIIGLYGVMSYMVARRRNEIGIRIALGADRNKVASLILREAGLLLAAGLAVGTALALAAGAAARKLLFGLEPNDPSTFAMAIAGLAVVAIAASYLPARRASRLDPMTALREE